jgi:hypothetical protein
MKAPFFLMAALATSGCATIGAQPVQAVSIGETAIVAGLRVRPVEVLEDSRCPASVQCVWAGRVRLLVDVTRGDGAHQQRDLTLGEPQNIDWGWLTLATVEPPKQAPGTLDPRAYRFTFSLRR